MLIMRIATLSGLALAAALFAAPASALTMKECSAKYHAAKDAGTLNGQTWKEFRKTECAADAGAAATEPTAPEKKSSRSKKATDTNATTTEGAKGLSMQECSTKYNAAKDAGTLGGKTWNQFRKAECAPGAGAAAATKPENKPNTAAAAGGGKGLTMKECSAKYSAAKTAGKLNGQNWNQFRKAECSAAAAEDETLPSPDQATYQGEPEKPTTVAPSSVKFPTAISQKYANETPGKARLHTCLDQYYAAKDANQLGGLKWIQKGGGYYSLCNAKLKG
ncbi:hypothetical protein M2281_001717 [Mesorhizobium soli]|jgi:hypothetical protein|uniref:hypothetical protein n=1 Tax=Pseudaminobacter soli (ex Li et al. 2025) TaxID=1295366 RepID=UPI002476B9DD|nr:hypothetical protein [Mesorhizobium soli]MDH6231145.1 hypothetical protein [Mesorhizobium soli]